MASIVTPCKEAAAYLGVCSCLPFILLVIYKSVHMDILPSYACTAPILLLRLADRIHIGGLHWLSFGLDLLPQSGASSCLSRSRL